MWDVSAFAIKSLPSPQVHGELAGPPGDDALSLEADGTAAEAQLARR